MHTTRQAKSHLPQPARDPRPASAPPSAASSRAVLPPLLLGLFLFFTWLCTAAVSSAAPLQQDTPTPSPSPSLTHSPSPTLTLTATLSTATATATATLTLAPSPSPSPSPTALFAATLTLTEPPAAPVPTGPTPPFPTLPPGTPAPIEPARTPTPTGPTPTLQPLPSLTYQYPGVTPRGDLLSLAQPTAAAALPKGASPFVLRLAPGRGWLLWLIPVLWLGLLAWFVITQVIARRH